MNWPLWAQILGFFGGGTLAGIVFIGLALREERKAAREVDKEGPTDHA